MIRTAKVIEDTSADDEVGVGKTVTIYIPEDDMEEVYTIVSTMRQPLKGFVFEYSSSILFSTGMKFLTQAILSCPEGASFISRTMDFIVFPPFS